MAMNYPYYSQQPQYIPQVPRPVFQEQSQIGIKGRPVSSIEEVRAASIDFDGSIFFFPDIANKKIYTKQINLDGTSILNTYELKDIPSATVQYVTKEEFELALADLQSKIPQQF